MEKMYNPMSTFTSIAIAICWVSGHGWIGDYSKFIYYIGIFMIAISLIWSIIYVILHHKKPGSHKIFTIVTIILSTLLIVDFIFDLGWS